VWDRENDNVARGFERITLQLDNNKNNTIIFFLNIEISVAGNSYRIHLYHVGCVIFVVRRKKKNKKIC
jgi:hypothetical protein